MEGEHGREAKGKLPVLDLLKRNGKGREKLIPNTALATPMSITRKKSLDSIVCTNCRGDYNTPDVSEFGCYGSAICHCFPAEKAITMESRIFGTWTSTIPAQVRWHYMFWFFATLGRGRQLNNMSPQIGLKQLEQRAAKHTGHLSRAGLKSFRISSGIFP